MGKVFCKLVLIMLEFYKWTLKERIPQMVEKLDAMYHGTKIIRVGVSSPGAELRHINPCMCDPADVVLRLGARLYGA